MARALSVTPVGSFVRMSHPTMSSPLVSEGNFGTGVRPSFFKPTPIIYLVFEKNDLFIYLIEQNVNIIIYCSLIFIPSLLSVNKVYK